MIRKLLFYYYEIHLDITAKFRENSKCLFNYNWVFKGFFIHKNIIKLLMFILVWYFVSTI